MTDNVVPGSITDNYTSRNRVTRPPPCPHMAGPRSPFPLRYLDEAIGFLVPRSQVSFPGPRPRPAFREQGTKERGDDLRPLVPSFLVHRFITQYTQHSKLTYLQFTTCMLPPSWRKPWKSPEEKEARVHLFWSQLYIY